MAKAHVSATHFRTRNYLFLCALGLLKLVFVRWPWIPTFQPTLCFTSQVYTCGCRSSAKRKSHTVFKCYTQKSWYGLEFSPNTGRQGRSAEFLFQIYFQKNTVQINKMHFVNALSDENWSRQRNGSALLCEVIWRKEKSRSCRKRNILTLLFDQLSHSVWNQSHSNPGCDGRGTITAHWIPQTKFYQKKIRKAVHCRQRPHLHCRN